MINYNLIMDLLIFSLLFIFPLIIYINILKYKKAALGLLFTKKFQTIMVFQIFAATMILYSITMFILILTDFFPIPILKMSYIILSIIMALALIYVFYELYQIMRIKEGCDL